MWTAIKSFVLNKTKEKAIQKGAEKVSENGVFSTITPTKILVAAVPLFAVILLFIAPLIVIFQSFGNIFVIQAADPAYADVVPDDISVFTGATLNSVCGKTNGKTKILFVGNSRTYVNDIPAKVRGFAEADGYKVSITRALKGGKTLKELATDPKDGYPMRIESDSFDCVVMQEQTDVYMGDYDTFLKGAELITKKVRKINPSVKTYIRQTWVQHYSSKSQIQTSYTYAEDVAKETNSFLIYDGKAFEEVQSKYPNINLFRDDRHQSNEGAYVSAAAIYRTLFGRTVTPSKYSDSLNSDDAKKVRKIVDNVVPASTSINVNNVNIEYDFDKYIEVSKKAGTSSSVDKDLKNTEYKNKEGFNAYLKNKIASVGYGTRMAVVVAGMTLAGEYSEITGKKLPYWDDAVYKVKKEQLPKTEGIVNDSLYMDCSNFAWWSLYNGGFKIPDGTTWGNGQPTTRKIKPWAENSGYAKTPKKGVGEAGDFMVRWHGNNGHIRLIVGTYSNGYYTAESTTAANGFRVYKYSYDKIKNDGYVIIDMTDYYNNSSNIRR